MTLTELMALLPFLMLAATAIALQLLLCVRRDINITFGVFIAALLLTLWSISRLEAIVPLTVTSLFIIDDYFIFFARLFVASGILIAFMAREYLSVSKLKYCADEFFIFLTLVLLGAITLAASQHFIAVFIGLELMGLSLLPMLGFSLAMAGPDKELDRVNLNLEAGVKYLVLSALSTALLLFGVACLYFQLGTLSFLPELILAPPAVLSTLGFGLVMAAAAFKMSLVPFHLWTPDVYEGAPTPVTALLATVSKAAVLVLLVRYIVMAKPEAAAVWSALSLLAVASMLLGNLLAIMQQHIKRILAYSSIAHMGYLIVAIIVLAQLDTALPDHTLAVEAVAFYLVAYIVTTIGAFAVVNQVSDHQRAGDDHLDFYRGLFWRSPWLASCLMLMLLSLAGIPLTMGFVGKFYIVVAGVQGELWWLLAALLMGSALGLYYYLRVMITLVQRQEVSSEEPSSPAVSSWVVYLLALILVCLGIYPAPLIAWMPILP